MYSVPRRKRLASSDWTRFFRWFPPPLGSSGRMFSVYFVARTNRSRRPFRNSPVNFSLVPLVYRFAVSTKFPPASANESKIFRLSSFVDPQPHSSPKVIVPRHSSDTLSPVFPSSLYRIASASFRMEPGCRVPRLDEARGGPDSRGKNFRPDRLIVQGAVRTRDSTGRMRRSSGRSRTCGGGPSSGRAGISGTAGVDSGLIAAEPVRVVRRPPERLLLDPDPLAQHGEVGEGE